MAFFDDLLAVFDQYGVGVPLHLLHQLYQLQVPAPVVPAPQPAPQPAPFQGRVDADGFVELSGITNPQFAGSRHCIKQVADTLPTDTLQRASAQLNLSREQALQNLEQATGFPGIAVEEYHNDALGRTDWRFKDPEVMLPNSHVWPPQTTINGHDLSTIAGVVAYCNGHA